MDLKPYFSIIIPAYNESKRLPLTLIDVDRHMQNAPFDYEIIVVDNNSKDATKEIALRFSSIIKNLKVLECRTQGKGAAVKVGMEQSKGKIRLFLDADNSVSVDQFFKMKHFFEEGYDVVIASRNVQGSKTEPPQPWYRFLMGILGNIFIRTIILGGIKDTQCGFKAFSERAASKIFPLSDINGWGFDVEILSLAKDMGFKIKEAPVLWVNSLGSKIGPGAYFQVFFDTIKIKLRMIAKYYLKKSSKMRV